MTPRLRTMGLGALALCASVASAEVTMRFVAPLDTDPEITIHLEPHAVALDHAVEPRGVLYVHLVGSCGTPDANLEILRVAAERGFHVVSLSYPNCPRLLDLVTPFTGDADIHERIRRERLYGVDTSPLVDVGPADSILSRLVKLLEHLDETGPDEGWGTFLTGEGEPRWGSVVVGGHSQGAGHTGVLAKDHALAGALFFAGPGDRTGGIEAPWLFLEGATPPERMVGFTHFLDVAWNRASSAYEIFDMGGPIVVDNLAAPYFGRHVLTSLAPAGEPGQFHGAVVVDMHLARDADGVPIYRPVWEYMLDTVGRPIAASPRGTEARPVN